MVDIDGLFAKLDDATKAIEQEEYGKAQEGIVAISELLHAIEQHEWVEHQENMVRFEQAFRTVLTQVAQAKEQTKEQLGTFRRNTGKLKAYRANL